MSKAKIILSAVGLLSLVGAGLAFKAQHRFSGTLACYTAGAAHKFVANVTYTVSTQGPTLLCTIPGPRAYIATTVTLNN